MSVSGNRAPEVGTGKLVGMLLVTWLTFSFFIRLGNLVWLWNDMHYRRRAAIALGLSLATTLAFILVVIPNLIGQFFLPPLFSLWQGFPGPSLQGYLTNLRVFMPI
ncbi:MAG: hypothetical protein ACE5GV_10960 [Candidatus Scalindua sp.]